MRTRVQAALLLFVVIAVAAFAVPLLLFTASDRTQQLVLARSADLDRFASLMDQAAATGDTSAVTAEVRRYTQLYGEALVVTDTRRNPVVQTGGMRAADPAVARLLDAALRNQTAHPGGALRPWSRGHRMFAEPAGTGTRVSGAVVLRASVETAADDITRRWAAVLAGAALAAVACTVLARAATGWVVSPLRRLDRAVGQLAAGLPPEQTRAGGPPELRQLAIGFNRMAAYGHGGPGAAAQARRRHLAPDAQPHGCPQAPCGRPAHPPARLRRPHVLRRHHRTRPSGEPPRRPAGPRHRGTPGRGTDGDRRFGRPLRRGGGGGRPAPAVGAGRPPRRSPAGPPGRSEAPVPAACTDRELAQITDILLDNAIKYAGPGAEISLGCTTEGPLSVLTVTDDGPGLGTEELALATTRFWRSGRQREDGTTGTGLGLAIAEQLLAGRGGRLELGPAQPRGLRARAIVPRAETDGAAEWTERTAADRADGGDGGDGRCAVNRPVDRRTASPRRPRHGGRRRSRRGAHGRRLTAASRTERCPALRDR